MQLEVLDPCPLSYSSMTTFYQCPWRWYAERTKMVERKPHVSALWGSDVHKAIELALKGVPLGERYEHYSMYVDVLKQFIDKADEYFIEHRLAIDKDWQACEFNAANAYIRGIVDFCTIQHSNNTALIIDHKTGAKRETEQLHLLAALTFAVYANVSRVVAVFYWLKDDSTSTYSFLREQDFAGLKSRFDNVVNEIASMCKQRQYPKRPGPLCKYCSVTACEYYTSYEERYYAC